MIQVEYLSPNFFSEEQTGFYLNLSNLSRSSRNMGIEPEGFDYAARQIRDVEPRENAQFALHWLVINRGRSHTMAVFSSQVSFPRAFNRLQRSELEGDLRAVGGLDMDLSNLRHPVRTLISYGPGTGLNLVLPLDNETFINHTLVRVLGPSFRTFYGRR